MGLQLHTQARSYIELDRRPLIHGDQTLLPDVGRVNALMQMAPRDTSAANTGNDGRCNDDDSVSNSRLSPRLRGWYSGGRCSATSGLAEVDNIRLIAGRRNEFLDVEVIS